MKIQVVVIFGNGRPALVIVASISKLIVNTALKSIVTLKNASILSNQNLETL